MKNASLILNIVLLIAVAFLFYHVFAKEKAPVVVSSTNKTESKIVYVNADSLQKNFPLVDELQKQFDNKRDSLERLLQYRDKTIKQEYAHFEQTAATLSEEQQQREYENFIRKQKELEEFSDGIYKQLSNAQEKMQDSIRNSLVDYLENYNKSRGYDYIMSYQRGSGILLANDSLDITQDVLKLLGTGR